MAETKYDLLLVNQNNNRKIYNQPWYKERLHTKHIKSLKPNDTSKMLVGHNWLFLKDGLDDFRDGLPPPNIGDPVIKGKRGMAPNIHGNSDSMSDIKQQMAAQQRFNKHEIAYSKLTPQQQQRRDHIEEIEYGLTQHPLALYPHLEESMPPEQQQWRDHIEEIEYRLTHLEESVPPELFEDVVDILDPEMNLASEEDEDSLRGDDFSESASPTPKMPLDNLNEESEDGAKVRNPYRWLPRKEEKDRRDKKKKDEKRASSPSQDEHIKGVTKGFCDWVSSLGGESNNIEETTITSLFASGYETKPALSVPIHVVELTNVPPELRSSAVVPQPPEEKKQIPADEDDKKDWVYSGSYEPSWVKFKYGAWYLPPKTWKKRDENEPLQDPKEIKDQEMSEAKKKSNALDADLAPMHGAKAFMDFIDKKNTRKPEFLVRVSDFQQKAVQEEQAKVDADHGKQKKQSVSRKPVI